MNAFEINGLCTRLSSRKHGVKHSFELDNINLTLPSGCIMGLIGENGAGKTTLICSMLGVIKRNSGSVKFFGEDESLEAMEEIGFVLGENQFPESMSALQINKMMGGIYKNWDSEEFFGLLKRFSLPEKLAFKKFSKGMKMKLSIAAALSHRARLLVLDEPTVGLDPIVRDEIVEIFYEFTRNPQNSVLISSHIVSDLEKLCDYIAFISKGKLILCEEKDRLLEKYGIIHCTAEELEKISPDAVKGKKESPYGVEAIVERAAALADMEISPVSVEELFVVLVKGVK